MRPYSIEVPCSPGDSVYLLCNDGIRLLYVKEVHVYEDYERDEVVTAVCFADYPYVVLNEETKKRMYGSYAEAAEAFKEFNNDR